MKINKLPINKLPIDILEIILNYNSSSYNDMIKICLMCKNMDIKLIKKLCIRNIKYIDNNFFKCSEKIVELNLLNSNITKLNMLKYCVNIEKLYVNNIINKELEVISNLNKLKYLTLNNVNVYSFEFIKYIDIKTIVLYKSNIYDLFSLRFCEELEKIYIKNTFMKDYYNLVYCKSLKNIYLYSSYINFFDMKYLKQNNIMVYNNDFH